MQGLATVIQDIGWYGVLAFVVTVFATPVAALAARRWGVLDMPDRDLKPHARPTPYLGGTAICLGWAAALVAAIFLFPGLQVRAVLSVLLGGLAMSALGVADDVLDIPAKLRLSASALIIAIVMAASGVGEDLAHSLLVPLGLNPSPWIGIPISFLFGLFIVLGACNSANLIDGLDGLCAGVTAVISLGFLLIAIHLAVEEYSREANGTRLVVAIAMLGATLGFLPMNFNPAKIFMGDAGSVLLGYNCGMLLLLFDERGNTLRWVCAGLMVFALPILDTALAIVRRGLSGRSILSGDRSHFYDQLVDRGMSVRQVVIISYGLAAFYALLGCSSIFLRFRYSMVLYVIAIAATALVVFSAGMVKPDESRPPPESP